MIRDNGDKDASIAIAEVILAIDKKCNSRKICFVCERNYDGGDWFGIQSGGAIGCPECHAQVLKIMGQAND